MDLFKRKAIKNIHFSLSNLDKRIMNLEAKDIELGGVGFDVEKVKEIVFALLKHFDLEFYVDVEKDPFDLPSRQKMISVVKIRKVDKKK